ncbi:MAG: glycosyltransferase [Kiritimatiellae bacterium]|nr:glycosyltransferase [Kiritimatiellia bacterium]
MTHDPLISVLMPAYNHGRYVAQAVRSVLSQGWRRVELLVVDDGSSDDTWERLQSLRPECEQRCERVEMWRQGNSGTCATLNRLLAAARGEFAGVLASDDMYLPGAFAALAGPLAADPSVGLVVGQNELVDAEGRRCYWDAGRNAVYDESKAAFRTLNEYMASERGVSGDSPAFGTYAELLRTNHVANGALVRRACLAAIEPCSPRTPLEDWWIMLQLSKATRMKSVPAHTFAYRWHDSNTVRQSARMEEYFHRNLAAEEDLLVRTGDWPHLMQLLAEHGRARGSAGIPGVLRRRRFVTQQSRITLFDVLGMTFGRRRALGKEARGTWA